MANGWNCSRKPSPRLPGWPSSGIGWHEGKPGPSQKWRLRPRRWELKLLSLEVRSLDDFESAFARAKKERAQALITTTGGLINTQQRRVLDFAAKNRLPAIYHYSEFVEAGGLMSYGPDNTDLWRRAADFVDKILKGAKPADLPVEQPKKFEFIINLKAAKQIGLTIPPNVLARADRVIK